MSLEIDMNDIYNEALKEIKTENLESNNIILPDKKNIDVPSKPIDETEILIDEEDLLEEYEDKWSYQIQQRGEDYYYSNNVLNVCKNKNNYIAKVGGNAEKPYDVTIEITPDDLIMNCTCPCTYPCKHEYAVVMAIVNGDYENVELKQPIKEIDSKVSTLIKDIPAEELKAYILSPIGKDKVAFEEVAFQEYFRKYLPNQKYEYYYNNLYNSLVLDTDYQELLKTYLNRVKQYISGNEFKEVVKIIKSIIEAYKDTNKINFDDYFTDILPSVGMYLRVTYRKSNDDIRNEIKNWVMELEKENYYNNYYLEDIILNIKFLNIEYMI